MKSTTGIRFPALVVRLISVLASFCALLALAFPLATNGAGLCSPDVGRATLNEYNHQDNYAEVKRLNLSTSMTGWKVRVYSSPGIYQQQNFPPAPANQCGEYSMFYFGSSPKDADIVLLDQNNDVVDILRVRTSTMPVGTAYYTPYVSCGYVSPPTDLQIDAAKKGVDRTPDGVGPWRNTPGVGAGSYRTPCAGNTPEGATTDLRVTKAAGSGSILLGNNVTFTVTVSNAGPNIGSTLIVTDLLPAGLTYVSHTVTGGIYNPSNGLWTIGTLAVGASRTLTLTASGNTVGTWTNTATVSSDNPDSNTANNSASAAVTVTSAAPGSLDAYEPTGYTDAQAIAGTAKIKTHTASNTGLCVSGGPCTLTIAAFNSSRTAFASGFTGPVKVEVVNAAAGTCSTHASLATVASVAIDGSTGKGTVTLPAVGNSYANARIRISYPATGSATVVSCSSDNFAIRPSTFAGIEVLDQDWQTAYTTGASRSLNNTVAADGTVHKAGQPFTLQATATNGSGTATVNYNGSPTASLSACLLPAAPTTCVLGTLNPGSWTAPSPTTGVVTSTTATYSEVGSFTMKLVDTTFANVDAADSSNAERHIESAEFKVGRFVPDHFDFSSPNTPQFKTFNDAACANRSFTYIGQAFGYVTAPQATVSAKNAAGATTANYRGPLWKLTDADLIQAYSYTLTPASTPGLDTGMIGTPMLSSNDNGTGTASSNSNDVLAFVRSPTTPLAPFTAAIALSMSVSDSSEASVAGNGTIGTATAALFNGGGSGIAFDAGNEFRYGRLRLSNAHGSELLNLPVPMGAQYWTGSVFALNSADNCTRIAATDITLGNYQKNLAACETEVSISGRLNGGRGNLVLTKPGAGNDGSVDLTVNLGLTATGNACAPASTPATPAMQSYLQGKWSGTNYDKNPTARATFGVYKNANEFIYLREMY